MDNFLQTINGQAVASSRQIAEHFGKRHVEVLDTIRELMITPNFPLNYFFQSTYVDSLNRKRPEFLMHRYGFTLLTMGFTGKKALAWKLKYIQAFNEMENRLTIFGVSQTFADALQLAANQAKQLSKRNNVCTR